MLRSNYRYSRDHQHHHHQHHQHQQLQQLLPSSPPASGSIGGCSCSCARCSGSSPVSIFFDEIEGQWADASPALGAAGQTARQGSLNHMGLSALGRRAREGFRRCQTSRDSAAEMSRSFETSIVQQLGGGSGSSTKLVKLLGAEVKSDEKVLFDHFYNRGRRNAFPNIFCGLSSRGLRRLFAVYGIDEVQTKPPVPPSPPQTPPTATMPPDSQNRERRRHRFDVSASRGGSAESRDSSGGGGGGGGGGGDSYRQRAGSASHQRQRRRRPLVSQHQQLASAAFTLLGCGRSSSADEERDDGGDPLDGGDGGCTVEDLGVVPSESADCGRMRPGS